MKLRLDLVALGLLLLALIGGLLLLVQRERHGSAGAFPTPRATAHSRSAALRPERALVQAASLTAPEPDREPEATNEPEHPHPITPEHVRLYHEVDLLDGAWHALRKRDVASARALVARHRSEYPGSAEDMNEGLDIVADCLEHPSTEIKERAQKFYDTKTFSQMRRRIRKLCLETVP